MSAIELGATLYVPATNPAMRAIISGSIPDLRSVVLCLEDSVRDDEVTAAFANIQTLLLSLETRAPTLSVHVRPRDVAMLSQLVRLQGIDRVVGFVLPKVTTKSLPTWLSTLMHDHHRIMPTIEGKEAFDRQALARLCDQLRPYAARWQQCASVAMTYWDCSAIAGHAHARRMTARWAMSSAILPAPSFPMALPSPPRCSNIMVHPMSFGARLSRTLSMACSPKPRSTRHRSG
jgi:citrate lyase beta subunit